MNTVYYENKIFEKYDSVLKKSLLFKKMEWNEIEDTLKFLNAYAQDFSKNSIIRAEGSPLHDLGIILKGRVMVVRIKTTGERAIFEEMGESNLFGDLIGFLPHRKEWANDIVAKTDCSILFIDRGKLTGERLNPSDLPNQIFLNLIENMSKRAEAFMIALRCFKTKSVRQRVANYLYEQILLHRETQLLLNFNRDELADFLFLPRPSLSRELSSMKEDGIIDFYKSSVKILDMEALKAAL